MTESAGLERGYRRLLAWYPAVFRREQEDEMLAVLMAGARRGQRRPGLLESADLIRGAVVMRLRLLGSGSESRPWADALALFSVVAPILLLSATILEVALPYQLPPPTQSPFLARLLGPHPQVGGLHLLSFQGFDLVLGCQVVLVGLVLLGLRWIALAAIVASVGCWILGLYQVPDLLQVLSASVYILVAAALTASPGPRRGRELMSWRYGIVLLLTAAAIQVSTLRYEATTPFVRFLARNSLDTAVYFVLSVVFTVAAASLAVIWKMSRYFLLLVAVLLYPYVLQIAFPMNSTDDDLIGHPTPGHLAFLFLPPLLLAFGAILSAVTPRRSRPPLSSDSDQPRLT
jgi:hypothetical protein